MSSMDDVRNELFEAASRILKRNLSIEEQNKLIDTYNNQTSGTIFERCVHTLENVLDIDLGIKVLIEKSANVDQVKNALKNLRNIAEK